MGRLRAILLLRAALAVFLVGLGVVLLVTGDVLFGGFAIAAGVVNAVLIVVIGRRVRRQG